MNWRLKSALRHALLALPGGDALYRWLTYTLMGSMSAMPAKWFRVFPSRVELLQRSFGSDARSQSLWCFDSGATMAAGLAMAVATDEPGLLTDRWNRLTDRYCATSRQVLREKGPDLARLSRATEGRVEWVLSKTAGRRAIPALTAVRMAYGDHAAAEQPEWSGRFGCVFSSGTLEHYAPDGLERQVGRMACALRPDGVMSHVVDHRDHRWHADKRLSPLAHLTLSEDAFMRRYGNPVEYHNRWLHGRFVELFSRHGFAVQCETLREYQPEMVPLDRARLAPEFRDATDNDLHALVTHFILTRP